MLAVPVLLLAALVPTPGPPEGIADRVIALVTAPRDEALPPIDRDASLDAVAEEMAREIASRHRRARLTFRTPLDTRLKRAGIGGWRRAWPYVEVQQGYPDPETVIARGWRSSKEAGEGLDLAAVRRIGAATARASDGDLVFVGLLLEDLPPPEPLEELERRAEAAVNAERTRRGLPALLPLPGLREAARVHSRDMAAHAYFDHRGPDGDRPADRVNAQGVPWSRVAENIGANRGMDDPVAEVLRGWMASRGHRENILDPGLTHAGIGAARAPDGMVYFTQVFAAPAPPTHGER